MAGGHLLMARKHAAIDHAMRSIASAQKDELALASLSKRVTGPLGNRLTLADLPSPDTKRWVVRRKAEVVAAVRGGLLSQEEACRRYALNSDEFLRWQHCVDRFGLAGLRTTRTQFYLREAAKSEVSEIFQVAGVWTAKPQSPGLALRKADIGAPSTEASRHQQGDELTSFHSITSSARRAARVVASSH